MSDPTRKLPKEFLHEAYGFEEDISYLLHYLKVPNTLPSAANRARRTMESCFHALYQRYNASLDKHYKEMTKVEWLAKGRKSREKIRSDLKKFLAKIPRAIEKNTWKGGR